MNNPLFRPPAEAESLILQIDQGCAYNRCTFCAMYRKVPYRKLSFENIEKLVKLEARHYPEARKIFLADGDVMIRPYNELEAILKLLNNTFPRLSRINLYANGTSITKKSHDQLRTLRSLKLHTLYMGLESGDDAILKQSLKGQSAEAMTDAAIAAQACGLRMSVMILLGLGGLERTKEHSINTAKVLNRMQPRLLSALRVIPIKGTELYHEVEHKQFCQLTEYQIVQELRTMISLLELESTVFRANHTSNVVPLEARFPKDKDILLQELDTLLRSNTLDKKSPGRTPLWL